ncbi:hypothetical protein LTS18_003004 [Coniosporium uncinatum]|uniref:Uncharacterized protein n=1 Tax=Coniosporium uncinatum TaxID=93489 RepID=A0ACC3D7L8_9PEZI|nr:hypothetical protein LTS18_003004 [Coniosporium uncinatum]
MLSYVVTGASRGLGYEFVRTLAQDRFNIVVDLVRDKTATDIRLSKDGISNVTIIQADITDFAAPQKAAAETSKLTGGNLDFLINNAASLSKNSGWIKLAVWHARSISESLARQSALRQHSEEDVGFLERELVESFEPNVVGVAKSIYAFLPLIKRRDSKKVITISTGMGDSDLVNDLHALVFVSREDSKQWP